MSARGKPFPDDGRELATLHCPLPACAMPLKLRFVATIGPHQDEDEGMVQRLPYYHYVCGSHGPVYVYGAPRVEKRA